MVEVAVQAQMEGTAAENNPSIPTMEEKNEQLYQYGE